MPDELLRPDLPPLPRRIRQLPVVRGYPVPWFVAWIDGVPDFRISDREKFRRAIRARRCWVCGERLGVHLVFVLGPMCGINRTTTEPPCHLDCADWSARACPFLARPHARRREVEDALTVHHPGGVPLLRNPGVALLWITREYALFDDGHGRPLIRVGPPMAVRWYAEGRDATREEVAASIESGYPALLEMAETQDRDQPGAGAVDELARRALAFLSLYPPRTDARAPRESL